ncbi:hypothetical protein J2X45_002782 [Caulobacter sp. BE264]|uniref:YkgJ family cysteine cluster protein n=1 Tax=Caulobacter sp. BE264 TaxID=2817724 RepID=UPI0028601750|nr:YkgJ family cysteine cluster protein [Caulobacter sp. BE264]MDR7231682.1 hypothetical protein [Caulobacter sp. BE264]
MVDKSCGSCGLCCKVLAIDALEKPQGAWCGHFRKGGGGCGFYEHRPTACRAFTCLWLTQDRLGDEWRPDKAGFVMYVDRDGKRLNVVVDASKPAAWKREPYYSYIKSMSRRALEGFELVVCIGDRRIVVFPTEDIDLGVLPPDRKLVSGYVEGEDGLTPFAMVLADVD